MIILVLGGLVSFWEYLVINKSSFDGLYNAYTGPFFFLSFALLIVSPFLFLINDNVFRQWFRFAGVWFALSIILILLAPEYWGGWMSFGPEKKSVSVVMSILFVILSFGQLAWSYWKGPKIESLS